MSTLLAILVGSWLGFGLALVPGLSLALGLGLLVTLGLHTVIGSLETACLIASAAGAALYSRNLSFVMAPSALGGNLASLDPALRLVAEGRSGLALRLMTMGLDLSWFVLLPFGLTLAIASITGVNLAKYMDQTMGLLGIPLILWWMWFVCQESKRPWKTLFGFILTGAFGYAVMHAPSLQGSPHQLGPLLAGLFGVPIAVAALQDRTITGTAGLVSEEVVQINPQLAWAGSVLGCLTGFFAGLGSGSLVAMASGITESDEDYILMSAAGAASNDVMALILIVAAGMGRSGEAILLGRLVQQPDMGSIILIALAIAYGVHRGRARMLRVSVAYAKKVREVPRVWSTALILVLSLIPVALAGGLSLTGQLSSWGLLTAGILLACWCKLNYLPNQVAFGSLALPLVVQYAGLTPHLNNLLF